MLLKNLSSLFAPPKKIPTDFNLMLLIFCHELGKKFASTQLIPIDIGRLQNKAMRIILGRNRYTFIGIMDFHLEAIRISSKILIQQVTRQMFESSDEKPLINKMRK